MNFLENIFKQLEAEPRTHFLQEMPDGKPVLVTGGELLEIVGCARAFLSQKGLKKGDRCALLAHNSIRWVAMDLALMAEGLIVVPLYARQAPEELVVMMKDCAPALICCGDAELRDGIVENWGEAPPQSVFDQIFDRPGSSAATVKLDDSDAVTIIYTSGTSGEAKGVVLNAGNISHMLGCTSARLDLLMENKNKAEQDRVFHYLPFCFAGSWIMLLTCLLRRSLLTLNTDLSRLAKDMRAAVPDYFLNVPALLERMRKAVDEQLANTGGLALTIYSHAQRAWLRKQAGYGGSIWLSVARALIFPTIRKKMIGSNLKGLICGSAPLNVETQLYFMMLGIPVLQVYGLTETTTICTMDDPRRIEPGRVGPAISGIEMKLGESEEIVVRGPNIFSGYWKRPEETAKALRAGWFHTGDQGEVDQAGNWSIVGRIKNLIVLGSGHNIAPEPIEDELLRHLTGAQQVVLTGNGRGYVSAIVTGDVSREEVQAALDSVNSQLPHYKQVRAFHIHPEPFSIDNGLLTANGKLKRELITLQLHAQIEDMYGVK